VHKSLIRRKTEGAFFTLYKELVDDEENFHQYFRMSKYQFSDLSRIEPLITKKNPTFQHVTVTDNVCRRLMAARCDGDEEVRSL
jgi:hypothetical protein